ncbi:GntR family transcriptional regulator [Curtobacterium sp. MCLR17_054]|uniref:GntR family transcriptional regulator n=1 Tax=Curtobacterium sp. MCLR17_054 TaxID=2175632 RepID=UPI000DAA05C5|nr:GntR family transcriptional regulator [Curtobacterium sp. MCLR17_054]WIE70327.1 GntR family transcriptional regulator [Curtobacterium sp. MCLR17_054]
MPVPKTPAPVRPNRTPLSEVAYQHLLAQISTGTLAAGAAIDDSAVAAELDMSPATVRQAISRLVEIGLIDMAPNRYTRVAEPSPARFIDTITVAVALWRLGGHLFLQHCTPDLAAQFHDQVQVVTDDIDTFTDGDVFIGSVLDVLDFLPNHSGNPVLIDTAGRLRPVIAHTARLGETAYDLPGTATLMTELDNAVHNADPVALDAALTVIDRLADEFITRHNI